jgi:hypothetical protein
VNTLRTTGTLPTGSEYYIEIGSAALKQYVTDTGMGAGVVSTPIALVNDKERSLLLFFYRNDNEDPESYLCLPLAYGEGHWINGRPKVGGLVHMRNWASASNAYASLKSAYPVPRNSGAVDLFLGYGGLTAASFSATAAGAGTVYRETGTTIPAHDSTMQYATRRMYLAGFSNEWKMGEVYGYAGSYSGSPVVTYTAKNTKTNDSGETTFGSKSITLAGQPLHRVMFNQEAEGLRLFFQATASAFRQESLVIDGERFGLEDSGR